MSDKIDASLVAATKPYISKMRTLPFLEQAEQGRIDVEGWHHFALERYHAARYFVPLIARGEELTRDSQNKLLHKAYFDNLQDERGLSVPGAGAHEVWRIDFYAAMGVSKDSLQEPYHNNGTRFYIETLKNLIDDEDIYEMSGTLLFLETTIPHEYRKILRGVEQAFPAGFDIAKGETEDKRKARHYLVDHIHHDAAHHARDLFVALSEDWQEENKRKAITRGMDKGLAAKQAIYSDMALAA